MKKAAAKIQCWQDLIDHINETWKEKKKVDYNYPFTGRDFKDLGAYTRMHMAWGMMALWDMYLEQADDYVKKRGFDIYTFTRQLPRLLDQNWKYKARQYEEAITPDLPPEVVQAIKTAIKPKPEQPKFRSRLEYLQHKKRTGSLKWNGAI